MRESERLSALIESVLDFARVERGKTAYQFDEGSVGDVVNRAVDAYRHRGELEGVEIRLEVEPGLPHTMLDEHALELALANLFDNAVKYAKDGKTIDVCVRRCGARTIEIRVTDHGPGIPREEQRRVFERFVRGKGASFFLSLPLRAPPSSTDVETHHATASVEDFTQADRGSTNHGTQD